jgi:CheY-like chemotaxis protein
MLLPKLGGREVMLALRGDAPTSRIPVLFFSSLSQANEAKLMEDGAAGYFAKARLAEQPAAGEKELIVLIEKLVRNAQDRNAQPAKEGKPKVAAKAT